VIDYVEIAVHPAGKKTGDIRVIPVKNSHGIVTRIVGIAHDITDKVNLQEKLDKEREEFSRRITSAAIRGQEIERSIVSRELHDNVNQVLTTVKLYVELCAAGAVNQAEVLARSSELLNDSINEIRNLSKRLSAPSLGDVGIIDTIKGLVETIEATKEFNIVFDSENICCSVMENELHLALYRIAQEQLTNIIKHAKAENVFIRLEGSENHVSLLIIDDGQGFDERKMKQGIGITNMASRTHILNGSFKIESEEGKGCSLWVSFPIEIIGEKCYSKIN
jgi:signal transduction histidine kinase